MPGTNTALLSTVIKNTSGVGKHFGFLPPHGRYLAAGEQIAITGDLLTVVGQGRGTTGKRKREALLKALENGDLTIVSTPTPIQYDAVQQEIRAIMLINGRLYAVEAIPAASVSESLG